MDFGSIGSPQQHTINLGNVNFNFTELWPLKGHIFPLKPLYIGKKWRV